MPEHVILLSIPGLRPQDLVHMDQLRRLTESGDRASLVPSFPCVTCAVQANMTTGRLPRDHGVVANGFYWRDRREVEMWTAWNDCILAPQIWDVLHEKRPGITSAAWFALHSKGCGADYVCTPAPIHNPDGSESQWCYTKPKELYETLLGELDHFPLQHFWGPLANIHASAWIADSAAYAARQYQPNFFYIYLPHLDYAAQKTGPDSNLAQIALVQLDELIGKLAAQLNEAYGEEPPLWLVASEYTITPVDHVLYPNRMLREAGLLAVREQDGRELLDFEASAAWTLADHQLGHVFVAERDGSVIDRVAALFHGKEGVAEVLVGDDQARYQLNHRRSGDVVLMSTANSWQAYYWWLDDDRAPAFARTVDIHNKPGYDPVEMHFDPAAMSIPIDAALVRGSHGAVALDPAQRGVFLSSQRGVIVGHTMADNDVFDLVLRQFGV